MRVSQSVSQSVRVRERERETTHILVRARERRVMVGYVRADISGALRMTWRTRMTRIAKSKRQAVPRPLGPRSAAAAARIRHGSTRQVHRQVLNSIHIGWQRARARGNGGLFFGAHAKCAGRHKLAACRAAGKGGRLL